MRGHKVGAATATLDRVQRLALTLLGSDLYDVMADHLADHESEPSIWPDVNEAASRVTIPGRTRQKPRTEIIDAPTGA